MCRFRCLDSDWKATLGLVYKHALSVSIDQYAKPIMQTMQTYAIDHNSLRVAHFLAQVGHESGELRYSKEIWGPSAAQRRYEGRRDLGNTQPGDGKRFMGHGLIQLTGRRNHTKFGEAVNVDVLTRPEVIANDPNLSALAAGWYWDSGNPTGQSLNRYADRDDLLTITRRINGGTNGLNDRRRLYYRACDALEWAETRMLQTTLNEALGLELVVDGSFGVMTRTALMDYQRKEKLVVDGVIGPVTWGKLETVLL